MEKPPVQAVEFVKEIFRCYIQFGRWVKKAVLSLRQKPAVLNSLKYGALLLLGAVVVLSLFPLLPIPGNFESLVVMSGSMEPAIHVGSVAFIKSTENIKVGDIVTFKNPSDPQENFTHRIVEISEPDEISEISVFKTKGDANDAPDGWELTKDDIVGKFFLSIPLLGYPVNFAKTPRGFIFLIILPAALIILDELRTIKNELEKKYALKYAKDTKGKKKAKNAKLAVSLILLFGSAVLALSATRAYFSDTETSTGNQLTAGTWGTHLVINEFMPNPNAVGDTAGEWFEIYNPTDSTYNLENWVIKDNGTDTHTINGSLPIAAGDYLVLCRNGVSGTNGGVTCNYEYSGFILANDEDEIVLVNDSAEEVDRVDYDTNFPYAAGVSAELKNALMDNNTAGNWEAATTTYGDGDYGTPGAAN